jgi:PREDICTED: similar to AMPK-beta subunit
VDGNEQINTNSNVDGDKSNNVINVKKSDFEVFEALAMDLASNTNSSNTSNASGSPPGINITSNYHNLFIAAKFVFCFLLFSKGSYSQNFPSSFVQKHEAGDGLPSSSTGSSLGTGPPILPPHLLQVILNNPTVSVGEPTLLPQPNHVMLNHLYALSIKDGVMVLSCTNRYRKKYVTTLLYKPI